MAGGPRPTTAAPSLSDEAEEPVTEAEEPSGEPGTGTTTGLIEGFEAMGEWWPSTDDASVVECNADSNFAHEGSNSLRFHYTVSAGGWADCGTSYEQGQDWSGSDGISLWMMSDTPGQSITWMVFAGDPEGPMPYEAFIETTEESVNNWIQVSLPWDDFHLAPWSSAIDGPLDTSQVTGYGFSIVPEAAVDGIIWFDEISLYSSNFEEPMAEDLAAEEEAEVEAEAVIDEPEQPESGSGEEQEPTAPGKTGGGLCASAAILPVLAAGAIIFNRKRMT